MNSCFRIHGSVYLETEGFVRPEDVWQDVLGDDVIKEVATSFTFIISRFNYIVF